MSPQTGEVQYGQYTNDTSPVFRVSLGDQVAAGELLQLSDNGSAIGAGVTITAAEIAQGYADAPAANLAAGWNLLSATITAPGGRTIASSMSFALGVATAAPASPTIAEADDGTATPVADGGHTADATPTFHVFEPGLPAAPTGSPGHAPYGGPALLDGHIQLYEGHQLVGDAMIGFDGTVTVAAGSLAPGEHTLTAVAVDRAGNVSAPSAPFHLFIDSAGGAAADPPPADGRPGGDLLQATTAAPDLQGGAGADTLVGADVAGVLHGGGGDDSIVGGSQANDVNGNAGDDTIVGKSALGDRLFGGQGDDRIDAGASTGHNLINGNRGADHIQGGSGGDTLNGGQGDDVVAGGAGADWISGDLGHNTLTGGQGADTFQAGQGHDLVTDFNFAQGDRVLVHSPHYAVSQVGGDTVIDVAGQGQMVLAGVNLSTLSSGWIVQA